MRTREVLQIFDKLEMEIREGRDTLAFFRWKDQTILWTKVPHKKGELKSNLRYFIRQQLKLNEAQLRGLIRCDIWREDYIEILKDKGFITP